jgi:hypothetical protein
VSDRLAEQLGLRGEVVPRYDQAALLLRELG